jgi:acetyl-CoA C-acetyltransferase
VPAAGARRPSRATSTRATASTLESLARLRPVFRDGGTVTAGNASGITDGAAALSSPPRPPPSGSGSPPPATSLDWEVVGVDPRIMGIGPVPATRQLLARTGLDFDAIDASSSTRRSRARCSPACGAAVRAARVNPDGGAIALGHPIGATGARILVTLLHGMAARGERRGIATLCVSGGMGLATASC